jgi:proteasome accessory factor B
LLQLLIILQSERFPNARRLAEACAVSRRTIYRDLTILEAAGLSVLYRPDRQGYQLARECMLQPTQLDDKEALALLIMTRLGSLQDTFGLLSAARSAVAKVIQALPSEKQQRIASSGELIADDAPTLELPSERQPIYDGILSALSQRKRLRLWYRERESNTITATCLGLYRLARLSGQWSLVGHSSCHGAIRVCQVPWIERVELTDEPYSIPPRFRLDRFLQNSESDGSAVSYEVQLRFAPGVAPAVRDAPRQRDQTLVPGPGGRLDLFLRVESLDEILPWVLRFGDQVEVLEPEPLRNSVRTWAERIIARYSRLPD